MNNTAKILVVDDEPDLEPLIRQHFRKQIKSGLYDFEFAHNGQEALNKIESIGDFDAIMTDINMPGMDGLTFLARLRDKNNHYKAIVVTAYNDLGNIRIAMNRGAFDFLTKPIDFSDLEATLDKTVSESRIIKLGLKAQEDLGYAIVEKEQAIRSERFKQQFLANMSHEIRTPLNAVTGIVNLLISKDPKPDQVFYLQTMRQASNNLLGIINDILDLAKIEAGKVTIEKIPFDFRQQLDSVIHTLKFKADEKGIELNCHIDPATPLYITGDPVRLAQILTNLISNAIKFTEEGEVRLEVSSVKTDDNHARITFKVIDQGIGIAPANINKIFESFTQENDDTTRKYGGTGLGLTITKQLIDLQHGTIAVTSEPGRGSVFTVELPYGIADRAEEQTHHQDHSDDFDPDKKINILLAEDQSFNQMVAVDTLELLFRNVSVDIANNGREAVAKAGEKEYSLVLMDINMPEMDGYEATRQIRKLPEPYSRVPVMAMTASVIKEEVNRCYEAGMNDFIPKPFEPKLLRSKIISLVKSEKTIFENQ